MNIQERLRKMIHNKYDKDTYRGHDNWLSGHTEGWNAAIRTILNTIDLEVLEKEHKGQ